MIDQIRLDAWMRRGRDSGRRFLLICVDVMDALKQDPDGGYYPVFVETPNEVHERLAKYQGSDWRSNDLITDACEGIIDLNTAPQDRATRIETPEDWLRHAGRH